MSLSPGEQPPTSSISVRRIVNALLVLFVIAVPFWLFKDKIREYRLYFLEDRPAVNFEFAELSEDWTEADLRRRFSSLKINCDRSFDRHLDDRACFMDVDEYNYVSAMFVAFFFSEGKLSRVSINVPWWAHSSAYQLLEFTHGKPSYSQNNASAGVRLHVWRLKDGSALFYNRDRPINPLDWNAILWNSSASCRKSSCLVGQ